MILLFQIFNSFIEFFFLAFHTNLSSMDLHQAALQFTHFPDDQYSGILLRIKLVLSELKRVWRLGRLTLEMRRQCQTFHNLKLYVARLLTTKLVIPHYYSLRSWMKLCRKDFKKFRRSYTHQHISFRDLPRIANDYNIYIAGPLNSLEFTFE